MLTLSSVSMHFGGLRVLEEVSLIVPERSVFGLIGPNGAGKTTLFNLASGLLAPSAGVIELSGMRLNGLPPHRITRLGIARTFQNIRLFKEMTLLENVLVALGGRPGYGGVGALLSLRSYRKTEQRDVDTAGELLDKMGLSAKQRRLAGTLSYGEQRRLEIARALATKPKLLLLDEPAAGMNGAEKQQLIDEILQLNADGLSVLIIDHDMGVIMGMCQEIAVLNFGKVIAHGRPDEIRKDPAVIEAYLGRDEQAPWREEEPQ
jgi:branched-chain amino acid transport system ATP-binding protein